MRQKQIRDLQEKENVRELTDREQTKLENLAAQEAEFQQSRAESKSERAKQPEAPMDPETKVAVDSIDRAIQDNPALHDFQIEDPETGEKMSAFDALQQVKEQAMTDADTGILHEIAAACGVS
jgi:hypothetical protein